MGKSPRSVSKRVISAVDEEEAGVGIPDTKQYTSPTEVKRRKTSSPENELKLSRANEVVKSGESSEASDSNGYPIDSPSENSQGTSEGTYTPRTGGNKLILPTIDSEGDDYKGNDSEGDDSEGNDSRAEDSKDDNSKDDNSKTDENATAKSIPSSPEVQESNLEEITEDAITIHSERELVTIDLENEESQDEYLIISDSGEEESDHDYDSNDDGLEILTEEDAKQSWVSKSKKSTTEQLQDVTNTRNSTTLNNATCAICFDSPEQTIVLPCGHLYCNNCAFKALTSTKQSTSLHGPCSLCRAPIKNHLHHKKLLNRIDDDLKPVTADNKRGIEHKYPFDLEASHYINFQDKVRLSLSRSPSKESTLTLPSTTQVQANRAACYNSKSPKFVKVELSEDERMRLTKTRNHGQYTNPYSGGRKPIMKDSLNTNFGKYINRGKFKGLYDDREAKCIYRNLTRLRYTSHDNCPCKYAPIVKSPLKLTYTVSQQRDKSYESEIAFYEPDLINSCEEYRCHEYIANKPNNKTFLSRVRQRLIETNVVGFENGHYILEKVPKPIKVTQLGNRIKSFNAASVTESKHSKCERSQDTAGKYLDFLQREPKTKRSPSKIIGVLPSTNHFDLISCSKLIGIIKPLIV
ncbi:hypothetical protein WICMUC_005500 [Wickerhamomyces mucosus]|uniref:RING-type domain-containing protein n=1 Tax=Wickerhamomyces mucosus TaxID=1378264 RepID=A0A9P8P6F4_9ASCO|nr:hypothetical protein WICMUC_005500 [Wickerhamomyces mucosus]